jgi:hypothetical protein
MGVDPVTAAMVFSAAGSVVDTVGNVSQNRSAGRRANRIESAAMGQMSNTPSELERLLRSRFNVGQDGGMQFMRSSPGGAAISELSETGSPFDTSEMFDALQPVRGRQLNEGLAALRAGAPGLGQRFGSAMLRNEGQTVLEHLQNIAAQDSQMQFQAHESAQGRRLQASQIGFGSELGFLQLMAQLEQNRRSGNLQALGIAAGVPQPGAISYGQPGQDIGQLLLLSQLTGGSGGSARSSWRPPPTRTPWTPPSYLG